jgi:hypothetical protein
MGEWVPRWTESVRNFMKKKDLERFLRDQKGAKRCGWRWGGVDADA